MQDGLLRTVAAPKDLKMLLIFVASIDNFGKSWYETNYDPFFITRHN